jgi:hypothetical protein
MRVKSFLFFIWAALLIRPVLGGPMGPQSVIQLAATADAIVAGPVVVAEANGIVSATIQVERVLKGSPTVGTTISLVWTMPPNDLPSGPGVSLHDHGVFFLQQSAGGSWNIIPRSGGDIVWEDTTSQRPLASRRVSGT